MKFIDASEGSRRHLDAELIHRSLAGDRAAARDLHAEYAPIAIAFLRRLGTRREDVEDACQEVFLRFFRYLSGFRGEAHLKTWLFRLCVTEARRARHRRKVAATLAALLGGEPVARAAPPARWSDATMRAMVGHALDRMAPEQREAFILFEVEGRTGKEVARIAGQSLPSTFRRLYEAERIVRETLGLEPN